MAFLSVPIRAQTVYVEDFDTAPSSIGGAFSVSIGGDADPGFSNNKEVVMGQWGLTPNGSFAALNVEPQNQVENSRLAGVFLDSTVINAGAGTYTLEFDLIGDALASGTDTAAIYVCQGSGYDASNFLVLDLAADGFTGFVPIFASDATFTPGTGSAVATQLASLVIDDTSVSQFNLKLQFVYDGTSTIALSFGAYNSDVAFDNVSIYKSETYATGFEGFTSGVNGDYQKDFNVAYGSSDGGASVLNTKFLNETLVQWGITANGNDFAGGEVRPQESPALGEGPANNVKMAGLFLDPALFASAGQYTITFDITGDTLGNPAYRAYVFSSGGAFYDFDEVGNDYLSLSLSGDGFETYTGLTNSAGAPLTTLVMEDISDAAVDSATNTVSITFTYDGTSLIAFAVGGYNNASIIDNFSVAPYEAPAYTIYGTGFTAFDGGTGVLKEFQGGAGSYEYDGDNAITPGKVLKHLNPQWGSFRGAAAFPGTVLQPQVNTATTWRLACIFLSPDYFKMGSGTYTVTFDLTGDPAGNSAYRAYIWKGSGTNGTTDYLSMDVNDPDHGILTGTGAAALTVGKLVEQDLGYQSKLPGTVQVAIDFTYTEGDTICVAVGGFKNSTTIDNFKVTTTMPPPGTVMYSTDFNDFKQATNAVPDGDFKQDFNIIYGSETDILVTGSEIDVGGNFLIDFEGFPSTTGFYRVLKSSDLGAFSNLTTPLFADTDGTGAGTATVPSSEMADPKQFFILTDLFNAKMVDSGMWGITGNGNAFADGIARPQNSPATSGTANNVKMIGIILDPDVFTEGPGTYTVSFEFSGDHLGNTSYRAFAYSGSGYDLTGTSAARLNLALSAGGFGAYEGLTGLQGASAVSPALVDVGSIDNGTLLNNAAKTDATRRISFDFNWDGTSAIGISIGGYNNASTIDNFFVTYVAP
jgi:hypothetical protein